MWKDAVERDRKWTKRVRLIQEEEQGESVVALSEHYGVSRKTLYKWLARDEEHDTAGCAERSRAPHHSPKASAKK